MRRPNAYGDSDLMSESDPCPDAELCIALGRHIHGRLWELYQTDQEYRDHWNRDPRVNRPFSRCPGSSAVVAQSAHAPHCLYRGGLVQRPAAATGCQWVECRQPLHPLKTVEDPTGKSVCSRVGCGPSCPGYFHTDGKPWEFGVSICIPHLNSPEQVLLGMSLWRKQTVRPYFLIVDTGSTPENLRRLNSFAGPDCEVHAIQKAQYRHPSCCVSLALDVAHGRCQTQFLFHTHTDVFPRRRHFIEWLIGQTSPATPVVGWRMSPRHAGPWHECVSHTATMVHNPTFRAKGLAWNLDAYFDSSPDVAILKGGWPDTESGLWWTMKRVGIAPKLLGDEPNHERQITEWHDHSRSFTCGKGHGQDAERIRTERDMDAATRDALARLAEWLK